MSLIMTMMMPSLIRICCFSAHSYKHDIPDTTKMISKSELSFDLCLPFLRSCRACLYSKLNKLFEDPISLTFNAKDCLLLQTVPIMHLFHRPA